jgi:hypothetical protein
MRSLLLAAALAPALACAARPPLAPSAYADDHAQAQPQPPAYAPEPALPLALEPEPAPALSPEPALVSAPASYPLLDKPTCERELVRRGVPFASVDSARGVLAPVRLRGDLHGVSYHSGVPLARRASSPWEIVDCRLVLALDDFAAQLSAHGIVEVVHYSMYRPPPVTWPSGRLASRHPGGLAIDAASFVKKDGETLVVERDFHGRIGAATCGRSASQPWPATSAAIELHQIVCDAVDAGLFHVALTPDFNWAHRNHFHLEVAAGRGQYVH